MFFHDKLWQFAQDTIGNKSPNQILTTKYCICILSQAAIFFFFCPSVLLEKQKCQHLDVLFRIMLAHTFSIYAFYFALLSLGPSAFTTVQIQRVNQGVTERCRLSWLTNSSLVSEPKCGGEGHSVSANEYSCAHGAQINLGDITPYLTHRVNKQIVHLFLFFSKFQ